MTINSGWNARIQPTRTSKPKRGGKRQGQHEHRKGKPPLAYKERIVYGIKIQLSAGEGWRMNYHVALEAVSQRFADLIAADIVRTSLSYEAIAAKYRVETKFVQRVAKQRGIRRRKGSGSPAHPRYRGKR